MSKINSNYTKLQSGYLFPEIAKRTRIFKEQNPTADIIRLGIGDTTLPLAPTVSQAMSDFAKGLGTNSGYHGYGDSEGSYELRSSISEYYKELGVEIATDEVFVSDGAKSDCANIQTLFESPIVALQDPAYPVYVDSSVISGQTGEYNSDGQYSKLVYLKGDENNGFVATPPTTKVDIIYLCFPNNPTGACANRQQLQGFVDYAIENKAIIIYDAAYSWFVSDSDIPKSIFEIPGAISCCIELNSFSKFAGFTGVRLGWSVIPKGLITETSDLNLNSVWTRRQNTFFNGACNIAQAGGVAALSTQGRGECQQLINYYLANAKLIKSELSKIGLKCFGGDNAPFIWLQTPTVAGQQLTSWEFFDLLLVKCNMVGTPGSGFGTAGEGYFRLSAFGNRERTIEALERIKKYFGNKGL
jgi:LL-diaminopimelate aminotransferase